MGLYNDAIKCGFLWREFIAGISLLAVAFIIASGMLPLSRELHDAPLLQCIVLVLGAAAGARGLAALVYAILYSRHEANKSKLLLELIPCTAAWAEVFMAFGASRQGYPFPAISPWLVVHGDIHLLPGGSMLIVGLMLSMAILAILIVRGNRDELECGGDNRFKPCLALSACAMSCGIISLCEQAGPTDAMPYALAIALMPMLVGAVLLVRNRPEAMRLLFR